MAIVQQSMRSDAAALRALRVAVTPTERNSPMPLMFGM